MMIEIDFSSDEAIYIQLTNHHGDCYVKTAGGRYTAISETACRYSWDKYAYSK